MCSQVFSTTGNFVPFSTIHGIGADHLELIQLNPAKSAELSMEALAFWTEH